MILLRPRKNAFVLLGLVLLLTQLTACSRTDPEKALRSAVTEMEAAVKVAYVIGS